MNLATLAEAGDRAAFDAAASNVDSVIATLREALPAERHAAIEREIEAGWASRAMLRQDFGPLFARDGAAAAWSLARIATSKAVALGRQLRHMDRRIVEHLLREVIRRARDRVETPWIAIEAVSLLPLAMRPGARVVLGEARRAFGDRCLAPLRHAVAREDRRHRALLAEELVRTGSVSVHDVVPWLRDASLRNVAERVVRKDVAKVEGALRAMVDGAPKGLREVVVRLLRTLDPSLTRSGSAPSNAIEEAESRLRQTPDDAEASLVWADALIESGDPRGEIVALVHAIAKAAPEEALRLSERLAAFRIDHRREIHGKSGYFPYREVDAGRALLAGGGFPPMRGKPQIYFDRLFAYAREVTELEAPTEVRMPHTFDVTSERAKALARALGPGAWAPHERLRFVCYVRTNPHEPIVDRAALLAAFVDDPELALVHVARLTHVGTRVALPFQEGGHYADGQFHPSSVILVRRRFSVSFRIPIERVGPEFERIFASIVKHLGPTVNASRFRRLVPTVDGKRMKQAGRRDR